MVSVASELADAALHLSDIGIGLCSALEGTSTARVDRIAPLGLWADAFPIGFGVLSADGWRSLDSILFTSEATLALLPTLPLT
jgi:hypothetical protein